MTIRVESQEKNKRSLKQSINSYYFTDKNKNLKKELSRHIVRNYLSLTGSQKNVLNLIIEMTKRYGTSVIPSQKWIANDINYCLRSVNGAAAKLNKLGIINKRNRGWKIVNTKQNIFKSKTCEYDQSKNFIDDMKFIRKNMSPNNPLLRKLISQVPAIQKVILALCLLTNLFLNYSNLKSNIKSIQEEEITFFGQSSYDISKKYEELEILPTSTLSKDTTLTSVLCPEHPGNVFIKPYPYNKQNNIARWRMNMDSQKRNDVDLRFCTKEQFNSLSYEDQQIASRYFTGKRTYGSVEAYETSLKKRYLCDKIWKYIKDSSVSLSNEEIEIVKSFPREAIEYIKDRLYEHQDKKNDFNWICGSCIAWCKVHELPIKDLLKKYGYYYSYLVENAPKTYKSKSYPYQMFKKDPLPNIKQTQIPVEVHETLKKLIGEEAFKIYCEKTGTVL